MDGANVTEVRFNQRETAEKLGVSLHTLLRLRQSGKLIYLQIGGRIYYTPDQIAKFLREAERVNVPSRRRTPRQRRQAVSS